MDHHTLHVALPPTVYDLIAGGSIPVGAWVAPPPAHVSSTGNPNFICEDTYRMAKEAGIDILYGLYENIEEREPDALRAMACALRSQMLYLSSSCGASRHMDDEMLREKLTSVGTDCPAHIGVLAFDEPAEEQLPYLGALSSYYRTVLPDKFFYVNMLPYCAKITQLQHHKHDETGRASTVDEYRHYVEAFISYLQPPVLSFDNYPCLGPFPQMEDYYFLNLSLVTAASRKQGIPVWCFIQTCSWQPRVRVPNREEILWQVNTALAYGIRGIQYFTFWQPMTDGVWQGGMIAPDGTPNPQYTYVLEANAHMRQVQHLLTSGDFQGILYSGDSPAPIPPEDVLPFFGPLQGVSGSVAALVGCFARFNGWGLYVVNNTVTADGCVTLSFKQPVVGTFYPQGIAHTFSGSALSLSLQPGAACYIAIEEVAAL